MERVQELVIIRMNIYNNNQEGGGGRMLFNFKTGRDNGCLSFGVGICAKFGYNGTYVSL